KRVTKDTPGAVRTEYRSPKWYGRVPGQKRPVPLSESKETARRMLNKLLGDSELASVGLVDPYAGHKARPLAEHLEDYHRHMAGKGSSPGHVARQKRRIEEIVAAGAMEHLDDLQAEAVVDFLAGLKERGAERAPLPAGQQEFTKAELVALVGLHPGGL